MTEPLKTFKQDRILRAKNGAPRGRIVLLGEYEYGKDIMAAVMEVFNSNPTNVKSEIFYIDGLEYKVPEDLPDIKITVNAGKLLLNSFYLKVQK